MRHECTEANLNKLQKVLKGYENSHERALSQMEAAQERLQGAQRGVLKRRFIFDITNLHDNILRLRGQILWAERALIGIHSAIAEKEQAEFDAAEKERVIRECCMTEPVTHNPFGNLKKLQVG